MFSSVKKCFEKKLFQFFILFFLLMLLNADSWFAPPFWDDIIGLHTQAVWLARNNFDFPALLSSGTLPGSPLYNPLNPIACIYALSYRFTAPEYTHFLAHTVNIAAIAGCGTLLFNMLGRLTLPLRLLFTAAALSVPLTVSACAGTGQESLLAFLLFLSLYFKVQKRDSAALAVSVVSWFFKLTGVILTFSLIADTLFLNIKKRKFNWKKLIVLLIPAVLGIGYYLWHFSANTSHFKWKPEAAADLIINAYWSLIPLFAAAILLSGKRIFSSRSRTSVIFVLLFLAANFLSSMTALPRYGTVIVFPVLYLFAMSMRRFPLKTNIIAVSAIIFIQLCNIYGTFLPAPGVLQLHDGSFMERSREFTIMRSQDQDFCRLLEQEKGSRPIVCPWPVLQQLTVPEFGYVKAPLSNVFAGEYPHPLGNFQKLHRDLLKENPLFIFTPDCYSWKIPPQAKIIFLNTNHCPGIKEALLEAGLIEDLRCKVQSGFYMYPVVRWLR